MFYFYAVCKVLLFKYCNALHAHSEPSAQTLKILDFEPDSPLPPASVVVASPTKSEITCNNVTMTRQNTEQSEFRF